MNFLFKTRLLCIGLFLITACQESELPSKVWTYSGLGTHIAEFSKGGEQALISTVDVGTQYWDLKASKPNFLLKQNPKSDTDILALAMAQKAPKAITADTTSIALWDLEKREVEQFLSIPAKPLCMDITQDGFFALVGLENHHALLINLVKGEIIRTFKHADKVTSVALSPNDQFVLIGSDDHAVRLWDLNSGTLTHQWFFKGPISHVNFSQDSQKVLISASDHPPEIRDTHTGALITSLKTSSIKMEYIQTLTLGASVFTQNNRFVLTGTSPGIIHLWEVASGQLIQSWQIPKKHRFKPIGTSILALSILPNQKTFRVQASDGRGYEYLIKADDLK